MGVSPAVALRLMAILAMVVSVLYITGRGDTNLLVVKKRDELPAEDTPTTANPEHLDGELTPPPTSDTAQAAPPIGTDEGAPLLVDAMTPIGSVQIPGSIFSMTVNHSARALAAPPSDEFYPVHALAFA